MGLPTRAPVDTQIEHDLVPIEFLIIGGSVCGLSAAIALTRIGHKATVVDIGDPFQPSAFDAGLRLPPNSTKVYYRWGLREKLHKYAIKSQGTMFASYDSGSVVGSHQWEEGVLEETGGDFLLIHHTDFRRILAEKAKEYGTQFRTGTVKAVKPAPTRPSLTLDSGEELTADVIIGADGVLVEGNLCRTAVMQAIGQEDEQIPTGLQLFNSFVAEETMDRSEDKEFLAETRSLGKLLMWTGPELGAMGYPLRMSDSAEKAFTFLVYVPRPEGSGDDRDVYLVKNEELVEVLKNADPRLRELAKHAVSIICVPIFNRPVLDEWIHPGGRLICIGEAAHPIPSNSTYSAGMSTGDAAVLGRVFSHLHRHEQIDSFLSAVQEIRKDRVNHVLHASAGNILAVSLPPGVAAARNADLRARNERGLKRLGEEVGMRASAESAEEMSHLVENIFGYDPEDEADNWWIQWGAVQERLDGSVRAGEYGVLVNTDSVEASD